MEQVVFGEHRVTLGKFDAAQYHVAVINGIAVVPVLGILRRQGEKLISVRAGFDQVAGIEGSFCKTRELIEKLRTACAGGLGFEFGEALLRR